MSHGASPSGWAHTGLGSVHLLGGVCSVPTLAAGPVSCAPRAVCWEALNSCCLLATLPLALALGFVGPSIGGGQLFGKMGVTCQPLCVKGAGSMPFGKEFVDLKDTANLWSI